VTKRSGGADVEKALGERINPWREGEGGNCRKKGERGEGEKQGRSEGICDGLRMQEAVDADRKGGIVGGQRGADAGCARMAGFFGGTSGGHESLGEQDRTGGITRDGIVIGRAVGGLLPGLAPRIAARQQAMDAGKKTQHEELPVVVVSRVGALVGESELECVRADGVLFTSEGGGNKDQRAEEADEANGRPGIGNLQDRDVTGLSEELAAAPAGLGETHGSDEKAKAAQQGESEPERNDRGGDQAEAAHALRCEVGFAAQVRGETNNSSNEGGEEGGADLDAVEESFAPACGNIFEMAANRASREGEQEFRTRENHAGDNGEDTEQAERPRKGHRRFPFSAARGDAVDGLDEAGVNCARAVRMLDSS